MKGKIPIAVINLDSDEETEEESPLQPVVNKDNFSTLKGKMVINFEESDDDEPVQEPLASSFSHCPSQFQPPSSSAAAPHSSSTPAQRTLRTVPDRGPGQGRKAKDRFAELKILCNENELGEGGEGEYDSDSGSDCDTHSKEELENEFAEVEALLYQEDEFGEGEEEEEGEPDMCEYNSDSDSGEDSSSSSWVTSYSDDTAIFVGILEAKSAEEQREEEQRRHERREALKRLEWARSTARYLEMHHGYTRCYPRIFTGPVLQPPPPSRPQYPWNWNPFDSLLGARHRMLPSYPCYCPASLSAPPSTSAYTPCPPVWPPPNRTAPYYGNARP